MDYMNPKVEKRVYPLILLFFTSIIVLIALTRRQMELMLSEKELTEGGQGGQAAWISQGLKLEEAQYVVKINTTLPLTQLILLTDLNFVLIFASWGAGQPPHRNLK